MKSPATVGVLLLSCALCAVIAAGASGARTVPAGLFNSLYSPVLDPGGHVVVPRTSLSPPPISSFSSGPGLESGSPFGFAGFTASPTGLGYGTTAPGFTPGFTPRLAAFASSRSGSSASGFTARSVSSSFASSLGYGTSAPGFTVSLGSGTPGLTGFAGRTDGTPGYAGGLSTSSFAAGFPAAAGSRSLSSGFSSPGPRASPASLTSPGSGSPWQGINPSQVVAIAENAGKFFARTFRAFSGSPSETVKFDLFTRQQAKTPARVYARKKASVQQTTYDPSKPTKVIIHGFLSHQGPGSGGDLLKNAFLEVQDCNVVTVDWSGADPREYGSAVKLAVPRVSGEVAELLRLMHSLGADLNDVHILGHSLGGQMAGAAGSLVLGPAGVGRVTGLDPAGPLFEGKDAAHRLDPTDAAFVDVIHTDGGMLGHAGATGHVDFFPDGGMHVQPGCGKDVVGLCSHCLVYDLLIDAVLRPGKDVYRSCTSWQAYLNGECGAGDNAVMGIYTDPRSRGSYYRATNRTSVRDELRAAGDRDLVGLFTLRNNPQRVDGVALLHC